jgi:MFS family permease
MAGTRDVFSAVLRNRDLRRVEFAFAAFNACEYSVWIAMLVYAYNQGGATTASVVAIAQLVPAALFAPLASALADRHPPVRVLTLGYLAQALGMGITAIAILSGAPPLIAYIWAAVAATAVTITRPTQSALLPALAHSAEELTAANVVTGWVENGSILVATAGTGVLLGIGSAGYVFLIAAVVALGAAALVAPVHGPSGADPDSSDVSNARAESVAGFRALRDEPRPRLVVLMLAVELTVYGAMDVLFVPLALSILDKGQAWVGFLNAAFAAGGLLGTMLSVILVGRARLSPPMAGGLALWGCTFFVIAAFPSVLVALGLLIIGGVGRGLFDVSARTLLQRVTPSDVLGRVFGVLEGVDMAGLALGALLVPILFAISGATGALVGVGILLLITVGLALRPLIQVDRSVKVPIVEIALLRSLSIFERLPAPAIEGLAGSVEEVRLPAGTIVMNQGDPGDRFYAIADGTVSVSRDGEHLADLGRGDCFGEIALISNVPRTATVTTTSDAQFYALEADPFVTAVTGHAPVSHAVADLVAERSVRAAAE